MNGRLAQLVERLPYKQDVISSSLVLPIYEESRPRGGFFVTLPITLLQRQDYSSNRISKVMVPAFEAHNKPEPLFSFVRFFRWSFISRSGRSLALLRIVI